MKRRILSFGIPLAHRYSIIAHQNSPECCLDFAAHSSYSMFLGLSDQLNTLPWRPSANNYLDILGRLGETGSVSNSSSDISSSVLLGPPPPTHQSQHTLQTSLPTPAPSHRSTGYGFHH